jgi:Raf kinase inhibitor-like YbhB/YbcL family protein
MRNSHQLISFSALAITLAACEKPDTSSKTYSADSAAAIDRAGRPALDVKTDTTKIGFNISSPVFAENGSMDARYTCEGGDVSPPLTWASAHPGTKSFALIVEDPDAPDPAKPTRIVSHWVLYNIPANVRELVEDASRSGLPTGAVQGRNERKTQAYMGPCPPIGRHRYFFKLFALDSNLTGLKNPTKAELQQAMQGHVLGTAELIGTYQKSKK